MNETVGIAHYWAQGDAIIHAVAYLLLLMSLVSWYFILSKTWSALRIRQSAGALESFWKAPTLADAIALLKNVDHEKVYWPLAVQSAEAAGLNTQGGSLNAATDPGELITRTLRREITRVSSRLEAGLTLLASVGSTAPFVGLLGTVWGIYHALAAVSLAGTVQIDKVAGPVGEADHDRAGPDGGNSCGIGLQRIHPRQPRHAGRTRWLRTRFARASDYRHAGRATKLA